MAYTTAHQVQSVPLTGIIRRVLSPVFNGLTKIAENNPRYKQIKKLSAMTDAELAEIGLRRDDIARHVFSDRLYI